MKIGFFELGDWGKDTVKNRLSDHEVSFIDEAINETNLTKETDFDIISVFIGSKLDKKNISKFPSLKFVATRSTGFDHIDAKEAKKRDILVSNVPSYGENTVAEFTFGLILSLTRKIYYAIDRIKEDELFSFEGLQGVDIKGKTIGVIGTGKIGKQVIKMANGFSMNIIANDLYPDEKFAKEIGFKYVPLEDLLKEADIVTLHTPYNESTHHIINRKNLKLVKKGAYLINTARGGLIETEALVKALQDGTLAGAALDVLEEEREINDELEFLTKGKPKEEEIKNLILDHVLMGMKNVLITPHNAFNSKEALQEILETTLDNIEAFIKGKPINLIPGVK